MIKVEIETQEYLVPSSWDEVNLNQLVDLSLLSQTEGITNIERMCRIFWILSKIDDETCRALAYTDFITLTELYKFSEVMPDEKESKASIEIEGIKYIPMNTRDMTMGEFISLEVMQNSPDSINNIPTLAAILLRPEKNGKIEPLGDFTSISDRSKLFGEKLMVGDYWPIFQNFFNGAVLSSMKNMQDYSNQQKSQSKLRIVNS